MKSKRSGDPGPTKGSTSQLGVDKTSESWTQELPRNLGLGMPSAYVSHAQVWYRWGTAAENERAILAGMKVS